MRSFAPFMLSVISWYTGSTLPAQSVQDALRTGAPFPSVSSIWKSPRVATELMMSCRLRPSTTTAPLRPSRPGTPSRMAGRSGAIGVPCAVYSQPAGVMLRGQR